VAEPTDEAVVETAADAAREVIFSRYDRDEIEDLDVRVSFEDGVLEVDVYVAADGGEQQVADDAALAARGTVDDLLREEEDQHGDGDR
jgi:hypothetical protein